MKEVVFSTGNIRKLKEAVEACAPFGINIIHKKIDIDEIQSHDPLKIAIHKAKTAYKLTKKPVVINDSFWEIPALNGFPGGYMKDICEWFSADDFINIMRGKTDRRICLTECIVYQDAANEKLITKKFWGEIAEKPFNNGNPIEQIAIFNGMTLGEHHQLGKLAYDPKDYIWNDFAEWFLIYNK